MASATAGREAKLTLNRSWLPPHLPPTNSGISFFLDSARSSTSYLLEPLPCSDTSRQPTMHFMR
jgi:hypothetical protein